MSSFRFQKDAPAETRMFPPLFKETSLRQKSEDPYLDHENEAAQQRWEISSMARRRGDSILSKASGVSFRSTETRDRADSSSTLGSVALPLLHQRMGRTDSRMSLKYPSKNPRTDSRLTAASLRQGGTFRTMQAISGFRRKRRKPSVRLGLEDIMKRNDSEWKQEEKKGHELEPRFSSTLSRESQFLMLKGYEDLLLEHLIELHPDKSDSLPRIKTPDGIGSLEDLYPNKEMDKFLLGSNQRRSVGLDAKPVEDSETQLPTSRSRNNSLLSSCTSAAFTVLKEASRRLDSIASESCTPLPEEDPKDNKGLLQEDGDDTQWHISYRIQNAMDALDKLKIANGNAVTSRRYRDKQMDPLTFYNYWLRKWREEFSAVQ